MGQGAMSSFMSLAPKKQCQMFVLITSLCIAFSGADIEFDFVIMATA